MHFKNKEIYMTTVDYIKQGCLNTWGWPERSINLEGLQHLNDKTKAAFKATNVVLQILGYLAFISVFSGAARIGHALSFAASNWSSCSTEAQKGAMISTIAAQILRGVVEISGLELVNLTFDIISFGVKTYNNNTEASA
jgi:hypothetical protein